MENFGAVTLTSLIALGVWLALTIVQVSTFAKRIVEAARARDFHYSAQAVRRRSTGLLWTIPGVTVLSIALAFGVEVAGRVIFNRESVWGWLVLVVVVLLGAFSGLAVVTGIIRKERPDYASIRADLLELKGQQLTVDRVAEYRLLLREADRRQRRIRIGRKDRAKVDEARAELEDISETFKSMAPVGSQALHTIRWSVALAVFWRASVIGLAAIVVSIVAWLVPLIAGVTSGESSAAAWAALVFVTTPLSVVLGIAGTRAALAARTAQHAVYLKQRAEVVSLLEEFDRTTRKGVAGLGDRVAKALQILRDQQG